MNSPLSAATARASFLMCLKQIALTAVALNLAPGFSSAEEFHPLADELASKPPAASAQGKPACAPAKTYVDRINAGQYDQISSLFAPDAVFLTPTGQILTSREQIGQFYQKLLGRLQPAIVPISFIGDGRDCVMELVAATQLDKHARYRLSAIDHFTVNDAGLIAHMVVYLRPQANRDTQALKQSER